MAHYSIKDLRKRKAELKAEANMILDDFRQSTHPIRRAEPHQILGEAFRMLVLPKVADTGLSLISKWISPPDRPIRLGIIRTTSNEESSGSFWRQLVHQGVDVIIDSLTDP